MSSVLIKLFAYYLISLGLTPAYDKSFRAEARIYGKDEYNNLTSSQKSQAHNFKMKSGWIDGRTPPPGFQINSHTVRAEPNTQLVSTNKAATTSSQGQSRVAFTSPPHIIGGESGSAQSGISFGRSGRRHPLPGNSTLSSVTLDGKSYHGPIFDEKGNKLN